jgi:hypothetical protein
MLSTRPFLLKTALLLALAVTPALNCFAQTTASALPSEISDKDFWRMIVEFSEPGGTYPYENFVSNELEYQDVVPALKATTKPGGVYIGVGPEQNFTYAAVLQSKLAFVIDIRRQNMVELLLYKALFDMSANRADFVSNLFSRVRPAGLDSKTTAAALFAAYENAKVDADLATKNLAAIKAYMTRHGYQLTTEDIGTIEKIHDVFARGGPSINYYFASAAPVGLGPSRGGTYVRLMNTSDATGRNSSYLAAEESYLYVREMQRKNLIVPLVGDFAGPSVIRNIGRYLTEHKATVGAFYISNVETYLSDPQKQAFYQNVTTLPVDSSSMFIRHILGNPARGLTWWRQGMSNVSTIAPMSEFITQIKTGRRPTFQEIVRETKDPAALAGPAR